MIIVNFFAGLLLFLVISLGLSCSAPPSERPNIVWITAEDMSPVLGYLGDSYAITPHLDQLAEESIIYSNAFATAPICSPSRAALINGMSATVQGAHQMRSAYPLPGEWRGFPALLRQAGYYTTNNVKTDYNSGNADSIIVASFDENSATAGWNGRNEDQPFFSIFNHMVSHQSRSMVWPQEQFVAEVQSQLSDSEIHDPDLAPVPPYYPDTPLIRQTIARFYDCVTVMDKQVGEIVQKLKDDGLWEETIVFFFSDHGTGLPRHKRTTLDSGMHVPLLVRIPEKFSYLAPASPGETVDHLVNFEDFGPSVLKLAGLNIPDYMRGFPFLGPSPDTSRAFVQGHRDRVDEAIDMVRTLRDKRYLYVRNYMPHVSYNQPVAWPDQGAVRGEFYTLAASDSMTTAQAHFAGPVKMQEELYDSETDPHNINNLVLTGAHPELLTRMRQILRDSLIATRDLGFMPEIEMATASAGTTPFEWARTDAYPVRDLLEAAEKVGSTDTLAFAAYLAHPNPGVRYWGAMGFAALPALSELAQQILENTLEDLSPAVQIQAASSLLAHRPHQPALNLLIELLSSEDLNIVLYAARAIEMAGDRAKPARSAMQALHDTYGDDMTDPGMFIGFSARGYLDRFTP